MRPPSLHLPQASIGAACLQEKLCGERSPRAAAEVVDETNAAPLQRHSGAARGHTHDWPLQGACQQVNQRQPSQRCHREGTGARLGTALGPVLQSCTCLHHFISSKVQFSKELLQKLHAYFTVLYGGLTVCGALLPYEARDLVFQTRCLDRTVLEESFHTNRHVKARRRGSNWEDRRMSGYKDILASTSSRLSSARASSQTT